MGEPEADPREPSYAALPSVHARPPMRRGPHASRALCLPRRSPELPSENDSSMAARRSRASTNLTRRQPSGTGIGDPSAPPPDTMGRHGPSATMAAAIASGRRRAIGAVSTHADARRRRGRGYFVRLQPIEVRALSQAGPRDVEADHRPVTCLARPQKILFEGPGGAPGSASRREKSEIVRSELRRASRSLRSPSPLRTHRRAVLAQSRPSRRANATRADGVHPARAQFLRALRQPSPPSHGPGAVPPRPAP